MTRGEYDALRAEQVELYLGLCAYCFNPMPVVTDGMRRTEKIRATLDHVDPRVNGGTHDPDNFAPACYSCNSRKSDRPLIVFLALFSDKILGGNKDAI